MSKQVHRTAIDLCATGMGQMGRFQADAMQYIDSSIKADENYCLPLVVKASMLTGANDARFSGEITQLLQRAENLLPVNANMESGLLEAISAASSGHGIEAATHYDRMLRASPDNLFLHVLAQEQTFWVGEAQWMRDIVERAAPHWSKTHKDYGPLLSLRSFANEEAGYFSEAEYYGRAAVEIDATDVWGAHSVAHVLLMKGQIQEGIDWLRGLCKNWGHANQMRHHLWWHFCLFLLEFDEYDRIIELLDTEIRNLDSALVKESPAATIDINNYSSLLMRLELYGVDVSTHWLKLEAICANRVTNHGSAFSNIHDMMVLSGSGELAKANELLRSMKMQFAPTGKTGSQASEQLGSQARSSQARSSQARSYSEVGIPVCEAILAHRQKDHAQVLVKLGDIRHQLHLMGASHAQRDVFYHLLVHAAQRLQRDDLRQIFIRDIEQLGFCDVPARAAYKQNIH